MVSLESIPKYTCWICGRDALLETCKADESRSDRVHELCLPRSFPFVARSTFDRRFVPLRFSTACLLTTHSYPASIRTLKEPYGARCTLGFDLKPGPITSVTGPGWLGAAI
jgi:hypothetical protein